MNRRRGRFLFASIQVRPHSCPRPPFFRLQASLAGAQAARKEIERMQVRGRAVYMLWKRMGRTPDIE